MFFYKLYGLIFRSNIELNQLLVSDDTSSFDAEIIFGNVPEKIKNYMKQNYTYGHRQDAYWFYNDRAIFYVAEGKQIIVEMLENVDIQDAIPFVLGYCMSMLFGQRNMLAVHCSCVKIDNKAILIAGYSGAGKSSLTTRFLESGEHFLTDDVAILGINQEIVTVYPAFPRQNLCNDVVDHYGYDKNNLTIVDTDREKYMISRPEYFCETPTQLTEMFVLTTHQGSEVEIEEITGTDKLKIFISNLFAEQIIQKIGFSTNHMELSLNIIQNIKIYSLKRPENLDTTEIQRKKIIDIISSLQFSVG